jgi:PRTRC genetic system protein E
MIKEIEQHLGSVDVVINITKTGGKFVVSVLPKPKTDDPAKNLLVPFIITGDSAEEVDAKLNENLLKIIPEVAKTTDSMNTYLDRVKEMEAESKMKSEGKKKSEELSKKINKKFEGFDDLIKEKEFDKAEKIIKEVLKMQPNNSKAINGQNDLTKAKSAEAGDLFSTVESKPMMQTKAMTEDEVEAVIEERNGLFNNIVTV